MNPFVLPPAHTGLDHLEARFVLITPDLAREWLARNVHNRTTRADTLRGYARDLETNDWKITGEAIKFSRTGVLLDGQHRLMACDLTDIAFISLVVTGLDNDSQVAMDTGAKRSAADMLTVFMKAKNATLLAAFVRLIVTTEQMGYARFGNHKVTHAEIEKAIEKHSGELDAPVLVARQTARQIDATPAVVAYAAWRLMQLDAQAAFDFFTRAAERVGLAEGDPVIAMGRWFAEKRRNRKQYPKYVELGVIFRCWNVWRDGQTMQIVKINSNGAGGGFIEVPEPR